MKWRPFELGLIHRYAVPLPLRGEGKRGTHPPLNLCLSGRIMSAKRTSIAHL